MSFRKATSADFVSLTNDADQKLGRELPEREFNLDDVFDLESALTEDQRRLQAEAAFKLAKQIEQNKLPHKNTTTRAEQAPTTVANPWDMSVKLEPLDCDNVFDFHETFWPEMELYPWQEATLLQLSGAPNGLWYEELLKPTPETPLKYELRAANGSGKSAQILARYALWYVSCNVNAKVVVTSASFSQLKNMTFRAIHRAAEDVNAKLGDDRFEITEVKVTCKKTRSTIFGFATDQPGRAEGYHPDDGGTMAVLIDEAKTITDEMFQAFSRFTGYSQWIEVSSPGAMDGQFYKNCSLAQQKAGAGRCDPLQLGKIYERKVTAFECPNIPRAHIEAVKVQFGENSLPYRTGILAEFTSLEDAAVIKQEKTIYPAPEWHDLGQPLRAGIDLSLGGDETVCIITSGNKVVHKYIWHIEDSAVLRDKIKTTLAYHQVDPANANCDGGGLGKVVIQMLWAAGCMVKKINNESAAVYKREFLNRGMEMYWKVMRLVEEKVLILPHEDAVLMHQLVTRRQEYRNGKLKLQSKEELSESPDRADAYVLAYASFPVEEILKTWQSHQIALQPKFVNEPQQRQCTLTPEQLEVALDLRRERSMAKSQQPKAVGLFNHALSQREPGQISPSRVARFSLMIKSRLNNRFRLH